MKPTDFGIAKAPDLSPMTATGDALGTRSADRLPSLGPLAEALERHAASGV